MSTVPRVEFCGEVYTLDSAQPFTIGREGDLVVDSNRFLHRHFLQVCSVDNFWWLTNIGSKLSVTVVSGEGSVQAWLGPQGRLPLVFAKTSVWFTAGATTYEIMIHLDEAPFTTTPAVDPHENVEPTTSLTAALTPEQMEMLVVLCQPLLAKEVATPSEIPTSALAAERLGWSLTKFNRKLDLVCEKLAAGGVQGLRGDSDRLAVNRRSRLVEYAIATRMVTKADLSLLAR